MLKIECPCKNVHLEITKDPIAQFFCHCDDCRVAHGGAYISESVYPADAVNVIQGDVTTWVFKRNPRSMCRVCGTRLFIDVLNLGLRGVNGYLLPDGYFSPDYHMQCQFAVLPVIDDLPHYRSRAPQFGGPEALVDW